MRHNTEKNNIRANVSKSRKKLSEHKAFVIVIALTLILIMVGQAYASSTSRADDNESLGRSAAGIKLSEDNPYSKAAFKSENMLPGDGTNLDENADDFTRYYCVHISSKQNATLGFKISVTEKEHPVDNNLSLKVTRLDSGDVNSKQTLICEGTFAEVEGREYLITVPASGKTNVYFKISSYLPANTGNDCCNKNLKADFEWYLKGRGDGGSGVGEGDVSSVKPIHPPEQVKPGSTHEQGKPENVTDDTNSDAVDKDDKSDESNKSDEKNQYGADSSAGHEAPDVDKTEYEDGKIIDLPKTGDALRPVFWSAVGISSLLLLILLIRKKGDAKDDN